MVGMNRLGKLEKILDLGSNYILHHDYAMDDDGNIVLLDFGEMLADYKASTTHAGTDESDSTAKNRWDWLHCNTIQLLDDGSALFSARETSIIIKITATSPTPADSTPSPTSPTIPCRTASITYTCSTTTTASH